MSEGAIRKYPCILAISSQRKQEFRRAESAKSRWGRWLPHRGLTIFCIGVKKNNRKRPQGPESLCGRDITGTVLYVPDVVGVFLYRAVGREEAGAGHIHELETAKLGRVGNAGIELLLRVGIGAEVGNEHVRVAAVEQAGDQVGIALAVAETVGEAGEDAFQFRITAGHLRRVIAAPAQAGDLVLMQTEEEHIVLTQEIIHLDIGAVERTDGDGPVHHQFHAAGAGSFLAGSRDLLRNLGGRYDRLRRGDAVILDKIDLEPVFAERIVVDIVLHGEEQFNDALGRAITGSRLGPEDIGTRQEGTAGLVVQLQLQLGNVHSTEKLAFIFVQALDLHVHNRIRIEEDVIVASGKGGKTLAVFGFDLQHAAANGFIAFKCGKAAKERRIRQPGVRSQKIADEVVQTGVDLAEPAAVIDAVGHIGKALAPEGGDITEEVIFDDIPVEAGHPVDLVAGGKAHVGHVDLSVTDDQVAADLLAGSKPGNQEITPAAVDLAHDLPHAREKTGDQFLRPLFQRFTHDRMVGIGHGSFYDVPGFIPAETVIIHKDAHEFGNDHGGVCVVDLNDMVLGKGTNIAPACHMLAYDVLRRSGNKEILLL